MSLDDFVWHVAGFLAPALFVALGVALLARVIWQKMPPARALHTQIAINFGVCVAVLLAGLALTSHDGRMGTYAALVLACAAAQAWQLRRG